MHAGKTMNTNSTSLLSFSRSWILAIMTLLFVSGKISAQPPVPQLWGLRIHDEAHVLTQPTIDRLEQFLKAHEDSTSNQIAVLIIPSLQGAVLEEYSLRVAHDEWKLGQAKNDNGVLLLIAIDDHKMRIEVGQGLEGALTDAICSRIIRNEMAPYFREGNYDAGVEAAVHAITEAIAGEYFVADDDNLSSAPELSIGERVLIGAFIFGILGIFTVIGLVSPGCSGWGLYGFLIPFYAVFPWIVIGLVPGIVLLGAYLIGFPILKLIIGNSDWGKRMAKSMNTKSGRARGGGWSSGSGWFGGSSGGSFGGGGGFSGGGGSFGGGGSSGSW